MKKSNLKNKLSQSAFHVGIIVSVLAMISIVSLSSPANAAQYWERTFASSGKATSVKQAADGGFILAGFGSVQTGPSQFEPGIFLIKLRPDGGHSWTRTWTRLDIPWADDSGFKLTVIELSQNAGYVVAGTYQPDPSKIWEYGFVMRTDTSGDLIWSKKFIPLGDGAKLNINSIIETQAGKLVLAGNYIQYKNEVLRFFSLVAELELNGTLNWKIANRHYHCESDQDQLGEVIIQDSDGDLVMGGKAPLQPDT